MTKGRTTDLVAIRLTELNGIPKRARGGEARGTSDIRDEAAPNRSIATPLRKHRLVPTIGQSALDPALGQVSCQREGFDVIHTEE